MRNTTPPDIVEKFTLPVEDHSQCKQVIGQAKLSLVVEYCRQVTLRCALQLKTSLLQTSEESQYFGPIKY